MDVGLSGTSQSQSDLREVHPPGKIERELEEVDPAIMYRSQWATVLSEASRGTSLATHTRMRRPETIPPMR